MKNTYEKPIVKLNDSTAEGVYAASGGSLCKSQYMNGVFQDCNTTNVTNTTTFKDYYGCAGCNLWRGDGADGIPGNHCALKALADYDQSNHAGSYATGANMPRWEQNGKVGTDPVGNETGSHW